MDIETSVLELMSGRRALFWMLAVDALVSRIQKALHTDEDKFVCAVLGIGESAAKSLIQSWPAVKRVPLIHVQFEGRARAADLDRLLRVFCAVYTVVCVPFHLIRSRSDTRKPS